MLANISSLGFYEAMKPLQSILKRLDFERFSEPHRVRVVCGALSASALASTVILCSVGKLNAYLTWSAYLFSFAVIPLGFISVCRWPDPIDKSKNGGYTALCYVCIGVFAISLLSVPIAVVLLAANLNSGVAIATIVAFGLLLWQSTVENKAPKSSQADRPAETVGNANNAVSGPDGR